MYKLLFACLCCTAVLHIAVAQHTGVPVIPTKTLWSPLWRHRQRCKHWIQQLFSVRWMKQVPRRSKGSFLKVFFFAGHSAPLCKTKPGTQKELYCVWETMWMLLPGWKEKYLNFISISGATDVKISGEGIVDGQGEIWWKKFTAKRDHLPASTIVLYWRYPTPWNYGITSLNPPNTHFH